VPRIICLDIGTVRIGVAVSDPLGMFAQGIAVWQAQGPWMDELEKTFERYDTACLLLGLPIREDGTIGPSARHVQDVAAQIQERFPMVTIRFWDERYSTRTATDYLLEGNVSRKKRKKSVDKIAASVILQSFMDSEGAERF
jgi:putative Holliday junction resolvase